METLGEEGKVEEAQATMILVDQLKKDKELTIQVRSLV